MRNHIVTNVFLHKCSYNSLLYNVINSKETNRSLGGTEVENGDVRGDA